MPVTICRRLILALLLLAVFLLSIVPAVQGEGPIHAHRLVLVSVPGLSFSDLEIAKEAGLQHIQHMTENGTLAAINMRTAGKGLPAAYLALGAGRPAVGAQDAQGFSRTEAVDGLRAEQSRLLYVGKQGADSRTSGVVVPSIRSLDALNRASLHQAVPGMLGQTLTDAGIQIFVWGSVDSALNPAASERRRHLPLMLMDRSGRVAEGYVDGDTVLRADSTRPYGVRMDEDGFAAWWAQVQALDGISPAVIGLEWGDLFRLYRLQGKFDLEQWLHIRLEVLADLDRWMGMLLQELRPEDSLWILSPQVNEAAWKQKEQLAPWISFQQGQTGGLYQSESTRRVGVVTFADVAPTLLQSFGLQAPQEMLGIPLTLSRVSSNASWQALQRELIRIQRVYQLRPLLLYSLVTIQTLIILAGLAIWVAGRFGHKGNHREKEGRRDKQGWIKTARLSFYGVLSIPLALLAAGGAAGQGLSTMTLTALGGIVLFGWGAELADRQKVEYRGDAAYRGSWRGIALLSLATALAIVTDGLLGAPLMKHSVLGYDPMIGARYYGIGNEYMGTLIGSILLGSAAMLQAARDAASRQAASAAEAQRPRLTAARAARWRRRLWATAYAAAFLAVAVWLAAPAGGANAGGALTAVAALGLAWARFFGGDVVRRLRCRGLALLAAGLLAAGLGLLWLVNAAPWAAVTGIPQQTAALQASDAVPTTEPAPVPATSHIGRAFAKLEQGSLGELALIVKRKLAMNLHLMRVSVWSKVLLAALLVLAAAAFRPWGALREWQQQYPYLTDGFAAIIIGSVAALLLNDSGIVAAATLLLHAAIPMLMLLLRH
jgi:hypothetical protein